MEEKNMKNYSFKPDKKRKKSYQAPQSKTIHRCWDLGIRLEHRKVKEKKK